MFNNVYAAALTSMETDVLAAGADLLRKLDMPARGCEYALVATAAIMIAVRNEGTRAVPDDKLREALLRTRRQAVTGLCGMTPCGIAAAVTTCFRVLLGTACPKSEAAVNTAVYDRVHRAVTAAGGDKDCPRFLRAALAGIPALAREYLNITLPADLSRPW